MNGAWIFWALLGTYIGIEGIKWLADYFYGSK